MMIDDSSWLLRLGRKHRSNGGMAAKQASTKQTMLGHESDETAQLVVKAFYSKRDKQGLDGNA